MDTQIVQKRLNDLAKALVAKGKREPSATVVLSDDSEPGVSVRWKHPISDSYYDGTGEHFAGDLAKALDDAAAFVAKQPTAEESRQRDFMAALGKVIDLGRQNGIEADYLNPIVASMRRLSENIITDQRAA